MDTYEKKYKERLEMARLWIEEGCSQQMRTLLESLFPELSESEDEKNANALIRLLNNEKVSSLITFEAKQQWLDWLDRKKIPSVSLNPALGFDPGSAVVYHNDESEDERIRKWIIEELEITRDAMSGKHPYSDDPDIVARLKRLDEAIYYLEKQKEQKPPFGIYWHKIKEGEKLPCRAYVWNLDYEKHYDCFKGRLIANLENISVGRDTWYLPADDVRNLPREGVDELPREQKPNIELIQRSWYMEGYHDREFGMEPLWIVKTGEGGPKHELNPKYGQSLMEQKPADEQFPPLEGLDAIKAEYYDRGFKNGFDEGVDSVKPVEWSDEDERYLIWLCRIIHSRVVNKELSLAEESELGKWIDKWINHEPQPVQKWDEFDEDCLKRAIWYVKNPAPSVVKDTNLVLWLECLPERFNLQPKQEWSEEDEAFLTVAIAVCNRYSHKDIADWLKSLRPQPHWKPSKEQMEALKGEIKYCYACGMHDRGRELQSLCEYLEKLM